MKVKCINLYKIPYLTIGKIYDVICENEDLYLIIDDDNGEHWYYKNHFKTLSEIRNEKINKLLEEDES